MFLSLSFQFLLDLGFTRAVNFSFLIAIRIVMLKQFIQLFSVSIFRIIRKSTRLEEQILRDSSL